MNLAMAYQETDARWSPQEEHDMDSTYQFWQYMKSGEIYAVRLEHGDVTGISGPLHESEVRPANLPEFDYDDQRDDVAWAEQHEPNDWRPYQPR